MNRRSLVGMLVGVPFVGSLSLPSDYKSLPNDLTATKANIVNHGNLKKGSLSVTSALICSDYEGLEADLLSIKSGFNYNTRISYSSHDKFKLDTSKAFIDYFVSSVQVELRIKVNQGLGVGLGGSQFNSVKNNLFNTLLGGFVGDVRVKSESKFGPSELHKQEFNALGGATLVPFNPVEDAAMQLNDLISGIVYSIFVGRTRNVTKVDLNYYFLTSLGLSSVALGNYLDGRLSVK